MSSALPFSRAARRQIALAIAVAASICAFAAPVASANDLCVHNAACIQAGNTAYATLEGALAAAEAGPSADRVILAPGTYTAPNTGGFDAPLYPVEIVGAGTGSTTLTGPDNTSTVLTLGNPGSVVSNLAIIVPDENDNASKIGLEMTGGTAKELSITTAAGASSNVIGAYLHGTSLEHSKVSLPLSPLANAVWADTDTTVSDADLTAGTGVAAFGFDVQVHRARVTANATGIWATRPNTLVTNSLIRVQSPGAGLRAGTGHFTSDVGLTARNVTVIGDGGTSTGVDVNSFVAKTGTVLVDSTILRGVGYAFTREAAAPGITLLAIMYSDYDPFAIADSGPGGLGIGDGNTAADPLFAGALDFHPLAGSPTTDAGNPDPSTDTLDLDGNPRVVGGRRDIGAFELQPAPPAPAPAPDPPPAPGDPAPADQPASGVKDTLAPAISGLKIAPARFSARHGARIRFKLSERARIRIVIQRRAAHGSRFVNVATLRRTYAAGSVSIAIKRHLAGVKLRPGRYIAVATATDAAGNRSRARRVQFRVVP